MRDFHGYTGARRRPSNDDPMLCQRCPSETVLAGPNGQRRIRTTDHHYAFHWHGFVSVYKGPGGIPTDCLISHPSSGHADIYKTAILVPDRVHPGAKFGD